MTARTDAQTKYVFVPFPSDDQYPPGDGYAGLAYCPELVDAEFLPDGITRVHWDDERSTYVGASWCDEHDHWALSPCSPTHALVPVSSAGSGGEAAPADDGVMSPPILPIYDNGTQRTYLRRLDTEHGSTVVAVDEACSPEACEAVSTYPYTGSHVRFVAGVGLTDAPDALQIVPDSERHGCDRRGCRRHTPSTLAGTVAARQQHVVSCCTEQYGAASAHDTATRALKAVEEAIELAHAAGITASQLRRLIDRDYAKAPGDLTAELGQLRANTLLVAATLDLDADALERDTAAELASRSVTYCQAKAAEKERHGTETPDTPVAPSDTPDTGDAL